MRTLETILADPGERFLTDSFHRIFTGHTFCVFTNLL